VYVMTKLSGTGKLNLNHRGDENTIQSSVAPHWDISSLVSFGCKLRCLVILTSQQFPALTEPIKMALVLSYRSAKSSPALPQSHLQAPLQKRNLLHWSPPDKSPAPYDSEDGLAAACLHTSYYWDSDDILTDFGGAVECHLDWPRRRVTIWNQQPADLTLIIKTRQWAKERDPIYTQYLVKLRQTYSW